MQLYQNAGRARLAERAVLVLDRLSVSFVIRGKFLLSAAFSLCGSIRFGGFGAALLRCASAVRSCQCIQSRSGGTRQNLFSRKDTTAYDCIRLCATPFG